MGDTRKKKALIIMSTTIAVLSIAVYYLWVEVKSLEREREAYKWRNFTCQVLLSEPKYRAIMCVKPFKKLKD